MWGNIEDKITVAKPQKAEQPANLKLTLLPFQQESLFWMRNQEKSLWHGGMLAVRHLVLTKTFLLIFFFWAGRDGVYIISLKLRLYSDSFDFRMGKTIQIIALFVSDDTKPNLVIA